MWYDEVMKITLEKWFGALEKTAVRLKDKQVTYNRHGSRAGKIRRKGTTNCVGYVMESLYSIGLLKKGGAFWLGRKIHGKSAKRLHKDQRFKILYRKEKLRDARLKPGDIVGLQWGPGLFNKVHTMVYYGEQGGQKLFYSFGPAQSGNWETGPMPKPEYDNRTLYVIIRIRDIDREIIS